MIEGPPVVIDLGCAEYPLYPEDVSIGPLIERFRPSKLYGFDPWPGLREREYLEAPPQPIEEAGDKAIAPTLVMLERKAAWTFDGFVGFAEDERNGLQSTVYEGQVGVEGQLACQCFDIAKFLRERWDKDGERDIVLKLDVEGAEYVLLTHLISSGVSNLPALILVEWHGEDERRAFIESRLRRKLGEW